MGDEATQVSASSAVAVHALCFAGIVAAHQLSGRGMLVSNPAYALRLLVVFEAPLVIAVFSLLRRNPKRCSFLKAAARGLLGLPIGAFLNAFGAIVLGAPIGINYCGSTDSVDYMISAPAHGAVIGAWLGAWPMPLDWERPWQEWPISVTYGSVAGHLIGMAISLALVVTHKRRGRAKAD
uniref:Uncharacterized protein n=1 Tax=Oryza barthii TaxID=65489 RepID=A0A0D3FDC1_9ORYZ